jgi:radical SAM protein with 4Fe4S-binding SPASM domain
MPEITPIQQYDAEIAAKRHTAHMQYPAQVHIETIARCNATCDFCPYPTLERKGTLMDDDLIQKVLNDLSDIPDDVSVHIWPFKIGEPFLDTRIFDILNAINEKLTNATISLASNATPITEKTLQSLARIHNIKELWLSVNDHRKAEYERIMGLPYRKTIDRLDMIHDALTQGQLGCPVTLSRVGDGTAADKAFQDWSSQQYPAFRCAVGPRGTWLGQVETPVGEVPPVGCNRWFELSITATGEVAHCCMDGQAAWPIGNVRDQHVLEVYNAPDYRRLRERTVSRLHVEPCCQCTFA